MRKVNNNKQTMIGPRINKFLYDKYLCSNFINRNGMVSFFYDN